MAELRARPWDSVDDAALLKVISEVGRESWSAVARGMASAGVADRTGKSCRLRCAS